MLLPNTLAHPKYVSDRSLKWAATWECPIPNAIYNKLNKQT